MKQFLRYLDYLLSGLSGIAFVLTGVLLPSLIVALLGLCLLIVALLCVLGGAPTEKEHHVQ